LRSIRYGVFIAQKEGELEKFEGKGLASYVMSLLSIGGILEEIEDCGALGDRIEMVVQRSGDNRPVCVVSDKATALNALEQKLVESDPEWTRKAFRQLGLFEKRRIAKHDRFSLFSQRSGERFALVAESELSDVPLLHYERQASGEFARI
jgi:hypothetical protein